MRYFNYVDLFTICVLLTAVAGRCSQLAPATVAPTLLATILPAPTIPCYFFYFILMIIYALQHPESLDILAAEDGLDIGFDIRLAHDHEAAEVFIS